MINSKLSGNGMGNIGSHSPIFQEKSPVATRKVALRDIQNDYRILSDGKCTADLTKVSGAKRFISSSPPFHQLPKGGNTTEHFLHEGRNSESDLPKRRIQDNGNKDSKAHAVQHSMSMTASAPMPRASVMTFSSGRPSIPVSHGKPDDVTPALDSKNINLSQVPQSFGTRGSTDQQRKERFLRLQQYLKQCDESDYREYVQMLVRLSPTELSRHAVELEKRSIQLTMEEGKEFQRMKDLNILAKSAPADNELSTIHQGQPNKFSCAEK